MLCYARQQNTTSISVTIIFDNSVCSTQSYGTQMENTFDNTFPLLDTLLWLYKVIRERRSSQYLHMSHKTSQVSVLIQLFYIGHCINVGNIHKKAEHVKVTLVCNSVWFNKWADLKSNCVLFKSYSRQFNSAQLNALEMLCVHGWNQSTGN